jgi:hypothetical protein
LATILEGLPVDLLPEGGPRFRAFLESNRDKIRKKLRTAEGEAGRQDVVAELEVASRLLEDRRFELAYEPYAAGKGRGPDFAVTFRTNQRLNLEVTRPRRPESSGDGPRTAGREAPGGSGGAPGLVNTLLNKAGQLPPGEPNVLVLAASGGRVGVAEVEEAARALKGRAERKEDDYFRRLGYLDARDFLKHLARLSAVFVLGGAPDALWRHKAARHPLPGEVALALGRCLG